MNTESMSSHSNPTSSDLEILTSTWAHRNEAEWTNRPEEYVELAEKLLGQGGIFTAYDVAKAGLKVAVHGSPLAIRLKQIQATALARGGAHTTATSILESILADGVRDIETLSMAAARHKESGDLERALELYLEAYNHSHDYYPGINAATLCVLMDRPDQAQALAWKVIDICEGRIANQNADYWVLASLGEAALVLGDQDQACAHFQAAHSKAGQDLGMLGSTRRQVLRIIEHTGSAFPLDKALPMPPIIFFKPQSMATETVSTDKAISLSDEITAAINALQPPWIVSSLISTPDAFATLAAARTGALLHLLLPCGRQHVESYCRQFDDIDGLPSDFSELILKKASAITLIESSSVSPLLADYIDKMVSGIAALKTIPYASRIEAIDTDHLCSAKTSTKSLPPSPLPRAIKAIFFADVVGYSEFSESDVVLYLNHFAEPIGKMADDVGDQLEVRNTWGDAQYFVFDSAHVAGEFSLRVRDFVKETNWQEFGFNSTLKIRMGLHIGPVYACTDPVTRTFTYTGTHVGKAARIEPVADENQVFVSEEFAAIINTDPNSILRCEYAGTRALAKRYGERRLFLLTRKD